MLLPVMLPVVDGNEDAEDPLDAVAEPDGVPEEVTDADGVTDTGSPATFTAKLSMRCT